ncbi:MAG TPA: CDP-archaeol synthase, partial [Acidimicrobiales bacterium]|nr:CDP-archaeol synthase [Acidimicrobiales bacterium]
AAPPWESRRDRSGRMPSTPAPPDEPLTSDPGPSVTAGGTELPHWSDPPTGEVPKILINDLEDDADDLAAWKALGTRGTRWRDTGDDWEGLDELGDLADAQPTGALDQSRSEHSDLYSFDEDFERVEAQRTGSVPLSDFDADADFDTIPARAATTPATRARHTRSATRRQRPEVPERSDGPGGSGRDDLPSRVVVGLALIILLIICYAIGSKALVVLATVVITAAAAEAYGMLQRSGFRPATLLGLVGTVGVCLGAYWRGIEALPLAAVLMFGGAMLWYLLRIVEARPLANVAVTTMTFVWVAVLGSYSSLMLRASHGKGLFLGAVVVAVAADIAAFLVGRWIGNRPMAPGVSPGKTVEGFIGGLVAALIAGAIIGKELTPWGGMKHGLVLGLIVGLVAPAGDLFESMIKRDLGVKDSGSLLPGHGGLLDRFDSLLVVLPAAYYVAWLFGIVVVK